MRKMIFTVLDRCGYEVLEARDGMEALQICSRREQPLDLVLTDVVMPHMNGRELAEQVSRMRPGLKILVMSGYADEAILHAACWGRASRSCPSRWSRMIWPKR